MLLGLGAADSDASEAAREYARLYPNRRHPDAKVIKRVGDINKNKQMLPSICYLALAFALK
jgi:hypothetical protein